MVIIAVGVVGAVRGRGETSRTTAGGVMGGGQKSGFVLRVDFHLYGREHSVRTNIEVMEGFSHVTTGHRPFPKWTGARPRWQL